MTAVAFTELLTLGRGLNNELPEVPVIVVAEIPELTFLAPRELNMVEVAGFAEVDWEESAETDAPEVDAPAEFF